MTNTLLTHIFMFFTLATSSITGTRPVLIAALTASPENTRFSCDQPLAEQAALIRKAETNDYSIRRLEFLGNERISDGVLRKRMRSLQEGEKFRRANLVSSLANVSRLKIIYPVRFTDVVVRLEESDKLVDLSICFREKKTPKK